METFKINYKSDFVLRLASDAGWGTAFTLEFWSNGAPTKRYYATHDGNGNYTNCKPDSDTELRVMFDDHGLGIGNLMLRITYSLADKEFRTGNDDEVVNVTAITVLNDEGEEVNVVLNLEGETAAEVQYSLPLLEAERKRQNAEAQRNINETQRIAAEQQRQTAEAARAAEFKTNEAARKETFETNEAERQATFEANEAERQVLYEKIAKNTDGIELLNTNTGVSEYPEFSEATAYAVGNVVIFEGKMYRFTSAHAAGVWDASQVEAWSERKEVDRKLTKLSGKISGLFGEDIHIPLPSYVVGEFWSQVGDTISYGDSPAPCRYQPIDVSEYIGKNATITIRWNSTPEPPSWLYLLFFKPTNDPRNDGKGFVMEADCYNAATNGQYTFDVEILDRYLYLSKRYEFTEISINIKDNGEIEPIVAESVEKVVKGNYGYNGQDLSWNWGYLSANGGLTETSESGGRKYTDLTPCIGGSMVRYRGETDHSAIAGIAFYNSEGNVISAEVNVGNINEEHTAIVPKGAAFFRLSINLSYQSEDSVYVRFDKSIVDVALSAYALAYASANNGGVAYVAPNGSDTNDGASQDTAYATIQRAIDGGASVIYVVPGTYTSSFAIRNKDSVTIMPIGYGEYSHATPNTPKIVIDGNKTREYGILAHDCKQLRMIGVEFANFTRSVAQIKNVDDLYFLDCIVRDNELYNGFQLTNVNGVLENCSAINIYDDGFNIHGYGCTHFINCTALNCHDDGISHHDGCTGFIEGGEYSGSGKAGIAPAYGANVNIANVVCKNNVIGIGYLTTENGHARMKGIVSNALLVGNTIGINVDELCDVIAYNNKYKNNEQDKVLLGNVEDYDL